MTESRSKRRSFPLRSKILLLLCTLLLLCVALEIGTRLLTTTPAPLLVKDSVIGKRYLRDYEGTVYIPEAQREISLRFNRYGFRGPDPITPKPQGVRRIAVLGDSFVASVGVNEEHTMVSRLENMLAESNPSVNWEVLNFGVAGSSPGQEITLYDKVVCQLEPDVVLCAFFVGNDLADNCRRLSGNLRIYYDFDKDGNYAQLPFSTKQAGFSRIMNRYSRFYVWQKHAMKQARDSARVSMNVVPPGAWVYCEDAPEDVEYAWKLTRAAVETLNERVRQSGAKFAMVLLPSAEQVYEEQWAKLNTDSEDRPFDPAYPEKRLHEICSDLQVPLVTMTSQFLANAPSRSNQVLDEWLFHQGAGHFNEDGNEIAATAVHAYLSRPDVQVSICGPSTDLR